MKILVVSQYFHPENFRVNELVSTLVGSGHDVTVLTGVPNYPQGKVFPGYGSFRPSEEQIFGARVLRVPMFARGQGRAWQLALNYLSYALTASLAVWTRLRGHFDAIFVFEVSPITVGFPAAAARRRFGAPVLFWVLDLWPESVSATGAVRNDRVLAGLEAMVRWIYARCDDVLVQSQAFVARVTAQGVPEDRVHYFPNWIEAGYDVEQAQAEPADSGQIRIVYAGNIGAAQDFPAVVEAATLVRDKLPKVRWVIAGDGRMASWLREKVEHRGLKDNFEFLGQLPAASIPTLFASADALLVSLRSDPIFALTVPGKVQSYLASGRPILAMLDGEGARIIAESGGGLAVAAGDARALAEKVVALAAMNPSERQSMGRQGRDYAEKEFGRRALFERLEALLQGAVARHDARH